MPAPYGVPVHLVHTVPSDGSVEVLDATVISEISTLLATTLVLAVATLTLLVTHRRRITHRYSRSVTPH